MKYTIKDVANMLDIPASTIRYYDKKGLIPYLEYDKNGVRHFSDELVQWLKIVLCFLKTGMKISELQYFVSLGVRGDETIAERREILLRQKKNLAEQQRLLDEANEALDLKLKDYLDVSPDTDESLSCVQLQIRNSLPL